MKNGKLLFLLVLVLSLTLFLFACAEDAGEGDETDTSSDTIVSTDVASDTEAPSDTAADTTPIVDPTPTKHELHNYFVLEPEMEMRSYENVRQYNGDYESIDFDYGLLAVKNRFVDVKNNVIDTVTVYDWTSGEAIFETSVSYPYEIPAKEIELTVVVKYPVIQVVQTSQSESGDEIDKAFYYMAKKDGALLHSGNNTNFYRNSEPNGLFMMELGDRVFWIDSKMEVLRSVPSVVVENGNLPDCYNEYNGYLYAWDNYDVQVFDSQGVCSAAYSLEVDGRLYCSVLNNGNVLIQEFEFVKETDAYDFVWKASYVKIKNMVMNYQDGTVTPIELNFVVDTLVSFYEQEHATYDDFPLPFKLAEGRSHQAVIFRYADGVLATHAEYVVLNEDLGVEYTVKNTTDGIDWYDVSVITENVYCARVDGRGDYQSYLFDLDGNVLTPVSDWNLVWVGTSYLFSDTGRLYDLQMNLIYDFGTTGLNILNFNTDLVGNVFVEIVNYVTGVVETYRFDVATQQFALVADGIDTFLVKVGYGWYAVEDDKTDVTTFFNAAGEAKLSAYSVADSNVRELEDGFMVLVEFEGKDVIYVLQ